jgi:CDP-glucose 4,6-dehydratase
MAVGRGAVEGVVTVPASLFGGIFAGRRVLITGHTGFKGSWLALWLLQLGAEVTGYALEPETTPSLYEALDLSRNVDSRIADIRDRDALNDVVSACRPEIVLHLAAQPLVRRSYAQPAYTLEVNVIGTANLLEAIRTCDETRVLINVTTDKVYANDEAGEPFKESDRLGGRDVYSASKACSEIVTSAYRDSFFEAAERSVRIATARAGNVVGGGDWTADRIVPDVVRALSEGRPVTVRNPGAVRPWQHVLEPLAGYLTLAHHMWAAADNAIDAVNFGPDTGQQRTVAEVVERAIARWGSGSWVAPELGGQPHEAGVLRLDTGLARELLAWSPVWGFDATVDRTISWYRAYGTGSSSAEVLCLVDIAAYLDALEVL